jgi:hypothetical protein
MAQNRRRWVAIAVMAALEDYDALVCPTFAVPALPAEHDTDQPVVVNGRPPAAHEKRFPWLDTADRRPTL